VLAGWSYDTYLQQEHPSLKMSTSKQKIKKIFRSKVEKCDLK